MYVDNGFNEVVIRYQDIPDFIVDYNKTGSKNLKVYEYDPYSNVPLLTTFGPFLNKCDSKVRKDIINRLNHLLLCGKIKKYKIINDIDLENVKN